ncbi:MAG: hypothetical protein A2X80_00500 [Geobacteraceae bacterium GWB2_52_12]|nr:MAG: hypothetical protein A2X80_00500 [Geobacteraceae bacterium GWB2_52_12]
MSQIIKSSLALVLLLSLFALSGCGDKSSQVTFDPATDKHVDPATGKSVDPAIWQISTHKSAALANIGNCAECHGSDFTGGTSNVSCTQCHLGGPDSAHPLSWGKNTPGDTLSIIIGHKATTNPATCTTSTCHAAGGAAQQKLCTSCHTFSSTSKHPAGTNFDADFNENSAASHIFHFKTLGGNKASCAAASCHGTTLSGGLTGPTCKTCHNNITVSGSGQN